MKFIRQYHKCFSVNFEGSLIGVPTTRLKLFNDYRLHCNRKDASRSENTCLCAKKGYG